MPDVVDAFGPWSWSVDKSRSVSRSVSLHGRKDPTLGKHICYRTGVVVTQVHYVKLVPTL